MKTNKAIILLMAIFAATVQAQELPTRASGQFSDFLEGRSYEADELPQDNPRAPFIRQAHESIVNEGVITTESVADGFLTFQTERDGEGSAVLVYQVGSLFYPGVIGPTWWQDHADPAKGFTVEFRVKALPGNYDFNFTVGYIFEEKGTKTLSVKKGMTKWGKETIINDNNDDDFHVFRIVNLPNSNLYKIWRDGDLIGDNLQGDDSAQNRFWFGDWSGRPGGGVLDYLRWDTSGAYAPVTDR